MCLVPDGDLFAPSAAAGPRVTDQIAGFTEHGIQLESGAELEADIVVTATGLRLLALGGMRLAVDGSDVALPETMVYKGTMLSGVPNLTFTFGYTNSSWTLKADLVSEYAVGCCGTWTPTATTSASRSTTTRPATEQPMLDFQSGYVQRAIDEFPRVGLAGAVAGGHELPPRRAGAAVRADQRRRDAVLAPHRGRSTVGGGWVHHRPFCIPAADHVTVGKHCGELRPGAQPWPCSDTNFATLVTKSAGLSSHG